MFAVGRKEEITEHSIITIIVQHRHKNDGSSALNVNDWLRVGHDSDEYSSMLAKELPITDQSGVPLGIIKSVQYVKNQNVALVQVVVRGTCLLRSNNDDEIKKHGWGICSIDDKYALDKPDISLTRATGPLTDAQQKEHAMVSLEQPSFTYLRLVSIHSAPANTVKV